MYLNTIKTKGNFGRLSSTHFLQCDSCYKKFIRNYTLCPKRRNNNLKHFCQNCRGTKVARNIAKAGRKRNPDDKIIDSLGYISVLVPKDSPYRSYGSRIREHIKVAEDYLGRRLLKGEVVHHIDGDKGNNVLANLVVMSIKEHNNAHAKAEKIVFELVKQGKVGFDLVTNLYYLK